MGTDTFELWAIIDKSVFQLLEDKANFWAYEWVEYQDLREDYGEERWKVIGQIFGAIITVIYTIRNTAKRLISARRASRKEREMYNKD